MPQQPANNNPQPRSQPAGSQQQPATAATTTATKSPSNSSMQMSDAGMAALRRREGTVLHYYNDTANNCTYGVGTLAHHGPCTAAELRRPVTLSEVNTQLAPRVNSAAAAVRQGVPDQPLTQEQFDALVSFVYNTGARGARATLDAANRGASSEVVHQIKSNVYIHPRDAKGHRLPRAICVAAETARMIKRLERMKGCNLR
ncbi:MAG TPA: glycoside hydrolase family protein [Thermoanaerobaculia bacterium]|jgi:lysozyme|nr:glycoside hydrolase family protein [Thermoanaerobaculia bacterium]